MCPGGLFFPEKGKKGKRELLYGLLFLPVSSGKYQMPSHSLLSNLFFSFPVREMGMSESEKGRNQIEKKIASDSQTGQSSLFSHSGFFFEI